MFSSVFTLKFSLSEPGCQTGCQQKRSSDINVLSTALSLETIESWSLKSLYVTCQIALGWIPITDNKNPEWYSVKDGRVFSVETINNNNICSGLFYYLENKTNKNLAIS